MDDVFRIAAVTAIVLGAGSFVLFMIPVFVRNFRKANLVGRDPAESIDAFRAELDELRGLAPRMAEMEERLDFAERLLTSRAPGGQLSDGPEQRG